MNFRKKHHKRKETSREVYSNENYDDDDEYADDDYYEVEDGEENELKAYSDNREKNRQKRKLRKRRLVFLILFILLAVLILVNWGTMAPSAFSETVQNFFSSFGRSRYPVDFAEGSMKAAVPLGSNIGVLTDTSFLIYSQNGDQLAEHPHALSNPAAVSGGGKALIYDRGGKSFRVETRYGEPFTSTAPYAITTAAMGDNGSFAIVTEAENYLSELTVYDGSYNSIFKWDASQGHILTAALSPDGRKLAAVVIGARNGSMFSDIYIYDLYSKTPVAVKRYNGELFNSIRFKNNDRIAAVGDSKAVFLTASGEQSSVYSYGINEIQCSSNGDGPVILIFKKNGKQSAVVSLDSDGIILGKANVPGASVSIVGNGDGNTVIVSNGQIWHAADDCTRPAQISVSGDVLSAISMRDYAFIFGTQSIGRYKLN